VNANRGWKRFFDDPIPLPDGWQLVTLRDAALYITKLPKAEHDAEEWQTAMQALLLVVERDGPTMFARIGVMRALNRHFVREFNPDRRALNRHFVREFNPDRKDTHWGRRKLARDR